MKTHHLLLFMVLAASACKGGDGPSPAASTTPATKAPATPEPAATGQRITIASFGGAYEASQRHAYFDPFAKATGIAVVPDQYNGELAKVKAMVSTGNVTWDVVDAEANAVFRGCEEGLLEPLDPSVAGDPKDYLPGAVHECGVASIAWSTVYAYDGARLKGDRPTTIADFFDLKRFPGKRALRRNPKATLEQALLADGVAPEQVYTVLGGAGGVERAFRKLDEIKAQTVWWEAGAQPPQLLADGEVVMAQAYNGRIYNAQVKEKKDFHIVWDGQVYEFDYWVIPKGTPRKEAALKFVRFALGAERMAAQTGHISYAPSRRSAIKLVDPKMLPHLPTAPENFKRALRIDPEWWADHFDEIDQRFKSWLAK